MTREILFEAIGEIDESFVAEADKAPKMPPLWLKIIAVAAALVLVAAGSALAYTYTQDPPPITTDPLISGGDNACVITPTTPSSQTNAFITTMPPSERPDPLVIEYPDAADRVIAKPHITGNDLGQYASPKPGECLIDIFEPAASGNTDPNTVYWLTLYLFDADGHAVSNDIVRKEAERLALIGYEIFLREESYTDYWGKEQHKTTLCGFFTKEHLETFSVDDRFGYILDFCSDDVSEYLRVSVIQTEQGPRVIIPYPEVTDTFGYNETE